MSGQSTRPRAGYRRDRQGRNRIDRLAVEVLIAIRERGAVPRLDRHEDPDVPLSTFLDGQVHLLCVFVA